LFFEQRLVHLPRPFRFSIDGHESVFKSAYSNYNNKRIVAVIVTADLRRLRGQIKYSLSGRCADKLSTHVCAIEFISEINFAADKNEARIISHAMTSQ